MAKSPPEVFGASRSVEILDIDMQMVRDALKDAPEFAKWHFENLLSQYEAAAARCEELTTEVDALKDNESAELEKMQDERNALQSRLDEIEGDDMAAALETVKYWLHDFFFQHRMTHSAREILRIVETAL